MKYGIGRDNIRAIVARFKIKRTEKRLEKFAENGKENRE